MYYRDEVTLRHDESGQTQRFAIRPRIVTDSLYAMRSGALLGLGVCVGSAWALNDDLAEGRLLNPLPAWKASPLPVYLTYPKAQFYPSRLLQFIAMMRTAVPAAVGM